MNEPKIHISLSEVQSSAVDHRLRQQAAIQRSAPQSNVPRPPPSLPPTQQANWWSSNSACLFLCGLIGGLLAWGIGEIYWQAPNAWAEYEFVQLELMVLERARAENPPEVIASALRKVLETHADNPYVRIWQDRSINDTERQRRIEQMQSRDVHQLWLMRFMFYATAGILMAAALSIAEPLGARNWRKAIVTGSIGATAGLVGGCLVGAFIDAFYQRMGGGTWGVTVVQVFARAISLGILGLFLSVGSGLVLRNAKRCAIGMAGGFLGGLVGGLLFDIVTYTMGSVVIARAIGLCAMGACAGLGTGLIEDAVKRGWLRVTNGLIAGKQFVLYRTSTSLGSSPDCEIYLFKDPQVAPRHAVVQIVAGGFDLRDLSGGRTYINGQPVDIARLRRGDQIQIGSTSFVFDERTVAAQSK